MVASGTGAEVKGEHLTLEDAFFALTEGHTEYRAATQYPGGMDAEETR